MFGPELKKRRTKYCTESLIESQNELLLSQSHNQLQALISQSQSQNQVLISQTHSQNDLVHKVFVKQCSTLENELKAHNVWDDVEAFCARKVDGKLPPVILERNFYKNSINKTMYWITTDKPLKVVNNSIAAVDPKLAHSGEVYRAIASKDFHHPRLEKEKSSRRSFLFVSHKINYLRGNISLGLIHNNNNSQTRSASVWIASNGQLLGTEGKMNDEQVTSFGGDFKVGEEIGIGFSYFLRKPFFVRTINGEQRVCVMQVDSPYNWTPIMCLSGKSTRITSDFDAQHPLSQIPSLRQRKNKEAQIEVLPPPIESEWGHPAKIEDTQVKSPNVSTSNLTQVGAIMNHKGEYQNVEIEKEIEEVISSIPGNNEGSNKELNLLKESPVHTADPPVVPTNGIAQVSYSFKERHEKTEGAVCMKNNEIKQNEKNEIDGSICHTEQNTETDSRVAHSNDAPQASISFEERIKALEAELAYLKGQAVLPQQ